MYNQLKYDSYTMQTMLDLCVEDGFDPLGEDPETMYCLMVESYLGEDPEWHASMLPAYRASLDKWRRDLEKGVEGVVRESLRSVAGKVNALFRDRMDLDRARRCREMGWHVPSQVTDALRFVPAAALAETWRTGRVGALA
jgi:hypothetical protein